MACECFHHSSAPASYANKLAIYHASIEFLTSSWSLPIKLVAAEAGFLPPGPAVDFADMVCRWNLQAQSKRGHATERSQLIFKLDLRGAR
jgi:hypothetical protein